MKHYSTLTVLFDFLSIFSDHFKDLLVSDVLPESRKLKFLKQRPLERLLVEGGGCGSVSCDTHTLILWYFEHQLKTKYLNFLELLKVILHVSFFFLFFSLSPFFHLSPSLIFYFFIHFKQELLHDPVADIREKITGNYGLVMACICD